MLFEHLQRTLTDTLHDRAGRGILFTITAAALAFVFTIWVRVGLGAGYQLQPFNDNLFELALVKVKVSHFLLKRSWRVVQDGLNSLELKRG